MMKSYFTFSQAIHDIGNELKDNSNLVHTERWQSMAIADKPEMATHELLNVSFFVPMRTEDLKVHQLQIKPNLPWADNHFLERVCGEPINPGIEWENWPYAGSARKFLEADGGKFNHNYMERYWPKHAGQVTQPTLTAKEYEDGAFVYQCNSGIRHQYGDLRDVISLLRSQPLTRQAYLPIFFPEDTGAVHGGRLPCSLGYHFIVRRSELHLVYYLRSCDYVRHFRDDIYLSVRLALWILEELRKLDASWNEVKPGHFTMHVTSMHCFRNDHANL
jgi:thymidylate synthase